MIRTANKVKAYINKHRMIEAGDEIVCGVSGGADSVCLLLLLADLMEEYQFNLIVANVEHGIRGYESLADTAFVEALAKSLNLTYCGYSYDVPSLARKNRKSEEEMGRILRYQTFDEICREKGANKIAVAHNANDNAETLLHNLVRGSSLSGLSGIRPVRDNIIRPILCLTREEIEGYLSSRGQEYRTDSSNFELDYTRNKLRLDIIPRLIDINTEAVSHINDLAEDLAEVEEYKNAEVTKAWKYVSKEAGKLDGTLILTYPRLIQGELVKRAIEETCGSLRDISRVHINDCLGLLELGTGKSINLPYGIIVTNSYNTLVFKQSFASNEASSSTNQEEVELVLGGTTKAGKVALDTSFAIADNYEIPKLLFTKAFDYDKIKGKLKIRHRKPGDRIVINQEGKSTKLKDYFINEKVPKDERDQLWLLCDDENIIWIIGYRINEAYKIGPETRRILEVKLREEEDVR